MMLLVTLLFYFHFGVVSVSMFDTPSLAKNLRTAKHHRPQHHGHKNHSQHSMIDQALNEWAVPMPSRSLFAGFTAPSDNDRWQRAISRAAQGEAVLLPKVLQKVKSPLDLMRFGSEDDVNPWFDGLAELKRSKQQGYLKDIPVPHGNPHKAPIVALGFVSSSTTKDGRTVRNAESLSANDIIESGNWRVPRKIVALGQFNENWGYLSTTFLNRSVGWGLSLSFDMPDNPFKRGFQLGVDLFSRFIDNPNVLMMVTNQHHNFTQEKVISLPLGVKHHRDVFRAMKHQELTKMRKHTLFLSATSNYFFRPAIRQCVVDKLGSRAVVVHALTDDNYYSTLGQSYLVFCPPGLGADTYRLWETLALGSIPVVEKGMGMDRTFYRLPVLQLEDYSDISELILRQAYVEAIYREDEWEYERLTQAYWEHLIYEVSEAGNIDALLKRHPMHATDVNFTRPLVPFDCTAMGGCGPGTKRVPKQSCAIDPALANEKYSWMWD